LHLVASTTTASTTTDDGLQKGFWVLLDELKYKMKWYLMELRVLLLDSLHQLRHHLNKCLWILMSQGPDLHELRALHELSHHYL
jgi:hypothetical protein